MIVAALGWHAWRHHNLLYGAGKSPALANAHASNAGTVSQLTAVHSVGDGS